MKYTWATTTRKAYGGHGVAVVIILNKTLIRGEPRQSEHIVLIPGTSRLLVSLHHHPLAGLGEYGGSLHWGDKVGEGMQKLAKIEGA